MGNINNMRNVANSDRSIRSYIVHKNIKETRNKPRLNDKTIKGTLKLIGPNAKKYRLSSRQRSKQLLSRVGLGIAGIAAAFAVANATINSNANSVSSNNTQYSSETQILDKDEVLNYAEETLKEIVYMDRLALIDRASVEITHNDKLDTDTVTVFEDIKSINGPIEQYSYTRYNNIEHNNVNKKNNTNPEIKKFLNLMIDVSNSQNPSYEDLENLDNIVDNIALELKAGKYTIVDKKIVENVEKDAGFEIGD